jgi:2-oxoisovalerate dehydrogenase E2 component (dihydrolipoyl transacylase)
MKALNPPSSPGGKRPYLANDIPPSLARDPLLEEGRTREKTTILTFLIKGLLLAMEEHPIMRSRARESAGERWLEIARDPTIAVAVSGKSSSTDSGYMR